MTQVDRVLQCLKVLIADARLVFVEMGTGESPRDLVLRLSTETALPERNALYVFDGGQGAPDAFTLHGVTASRGATGQANLAPHRTF